MMIYIDFDGVIVDSWPVILEEYKKNFGNSNIEEVKLRELFKIISWNKVLNKSKLNIKNIAALKRCEGDNLAILTKYNTVEEKNEKEIFWKKQNIDIKIFFVDIDLPKTSINNVKNNFLIDDESKNLDAWSLAGGIGILYSKNNNHKDSDEIFNEKYVEIHEITYELLKKLLTSCN